MQRPHPNGGVSAPVAGDARLRALWSNRLVGLDLVDAEGRWLDVNDRLCEILDRPRAGLLGTLVESLTHPDDIEAERACIRRLMEGELGAFRLKKRFAGGTGRWTWVEVDVSLAPAGGGELLRASVVQQLPDHSPHADGIIAVDSAWQANLPGRSPAEQANRNDALVRQILYSAPLPMGIVELADDDKDILHVFDNPATCRAFGVAPGETVGRLDGADFRVPRTALKTWISAYRASQRLEHAVHFEDCFDLDKGRRCLGVVVSYVGPGPGGRDRFCYVAEDITERRLAEQERERLLQGLREADRRKDEFLAMLAHELRSPLSAANNAAQILQMRAPNDPDLRWCCDVVHRQSGQLARLLDDLLDVSRISRGKIILRREFVDLRGVVQRAVETATPLIEVKRHRVDVHLPDEALTIQVDPSRIEQVIVNLLANAAKYSEEGRTIRIRAGRDGSWSVVQVEDQGVGMTPEDLEQVFDPFAQAETSIERSQGGLGIGLTIARSLVVLHGGALTAASPGPGLGSVFSIRLPSIEVVHAEPTASPPSSKPRAASLRVLVVDDNADAARSLALMLDAAGQITATAFDGATAIEVAASFDPDAVILDIGLPGMDGYEVASRLRSLPGGARLQLVALTGYGREEDVRRAFDAGFDKHIIKPAKLDTILDAIAALPTGS